MAIMIQPEYLHCTDNGSNKFYCVVLMPGRRKALLGYGRAGSQAVGTWTEETVDKGRRRLAEKQNKGYKTTPHDTLPAPARDHLLHLISNEFGGRSARFGGSGGTIIVESGMETATKPKAAAPKRKHGRPVDVWLSEGSC